jgi:hypothetical protein
MEFDHYHKRADEILTDIEKKHDDASKWISPGCATQIALAQVYATMALATKPEPTRLVEVDR